MDRSVALAAADRIERIILSRVDFPGFLEHGKTHFDTSDSTAGQSRTTAPLTI